jgi:hypothetical protein
LGEHGSLGFEAFGGFILEDLPANGDGLGGKRWGEDEAGPKGDAVVPGFAGGDAEEEGVGGEARAGGGKGQEQGAAGHQDRL